MGSPIQSGLAPAPQDGRKELLLKMYDQMFNDINRHILVVWQSVSVLVGAIALLALAEKNVLPVDIAISLIVLLGMWLLAHLYDASYWYNRNLVIIANIERQFLTVGDLNDIHYYFSSHRKYKMISHFQVQYALGIGIVALVMAYHFFTRVLPGFGSGLDLFDPLRTLPYLTALGAVLFLVVFAIKKDESYREFLANSPGVPVPEEAKARLKFGVGHSFGSALRVAIDRLRGKHGQRQLHP
jgi:hypothetical protein